MMDKRVQYGLFFIISFLLIACAQVVAPTGGEKDILAPEVLKMQPENEQTNFTAKEIVIFFNEYVKLSRLKDELIISPPLKYDLGTKIKGRSLILNIKDTLKENTTYVLNFGNSIVDIRENNPIPDFKYVFSTGNEIDTFSITGRLIEAYSSKVEKGVFIMLYDSFEDSIPTKELPTYLARTDEDGAYRVGNIKKGTYKVFALKDANKNYLFDRPDEKISFDTTLLEINDNGINLNYYLFEENNEIQFIKEQKEKLSNAVIHFNIPFDTIIVDALDTSLKEVLKSEDFGMNKDSVSLWFNEMDKQRLKLTVSDLQGLKDTITVKIDSAPKRFKIEFPNEFNYFEKVRLRSNTPFKKFRNERIKIFGLDSLPIEFNTSYGKHSQEVILSFESKPDSSYHISILPEAFEDVYGKYNDSINRQIKFNSSADFGNLIVNLDSKIQEPMFIQLLNSKGDVIRELNINDSEVFFKNLKPNTYKLRGVLDRNNNGKWDTGNYFEKLLPERTILFTEDVVIRSNWDKELKWELNIND